jgi:hypothetical protein
MALTFPDPVIGTIVRPRGQGCTSCVHTKQCRTFYWLRREIYINSGKEVDTMLGVACTSWSNNPALFPTDPPTQDDLNYMDDIDKEGISGEPDRNGIQDPVTAGPNQF